MVCQQASVRLLMYPQQVAPRISLIPQTTQPTSPQLKDVVSTCLGGKNTNTVDIINLPVLITFDFIAFVDFYRFDPISERQHQGTIKPRVNNRAL